MKKRIYKSSQAKHPLAFKRYTSMGGGGGAKGARRRSNSDSIKKKRADKDQEFEMMENSNILDDSALVMLDDFSNEVDQMSGREQRVKKSKDT